MTTDQLKRLLEDEDDFLKFGEVGAKLSQRPDLHAFLLLDRLVPGDRDIVDGARHDVIFLSVDPEELAKVITEEQVRDLRRCGVRWDDDHESLAMFA